MNVNRANGSDAPCAELLRLLLQREIWAKCAKLHLDSTVRITAQICCCSARHDSQMRGPSAHRRRHVFARVRCVIECSVFDARRRISLNMFSAPTTGRAVRVDLNGTAVLQCADAVQTCAGTRRATHQVWDGPDHL